MTDKRIPIVLAAVLGSAAVLASGGTSSGGSGGGGGDKQPLNGLGSSSANKDAKIIKCAVDNLGDLDAVVKITNHSSKRSDYSVTVEYDSKSGKNQLDTGDVFVQHLRPGQSTTQHATSMGTAPKKGFTCQLSEVERTASV
jgi:hypothetical protein